jgi:hypothetical protein
MNKVRTFQIAAVVLGFAAIYFAVTDPRGDYLFASVVLTISAAFLAYRFHLKEQIEGRNPTRREGAPMRVKDEDKD